MAGDGGAIMSATRLIEQVKREAVEKAGLPALKKEEQPAYPLVPIFIGLDDASGQGLREVGCVAWGQACAASCRRAAAKHALGAAAAADADAPLFAPHPLLPTHATQTANPLPPRR